MKSESKLDPGLVAEAVSKAVIPSCMDEIMNMIKAFKSSYQGELPNIYLTPLTKY